MGAHILIVEDDLSLQTLLRYNLELEGFTITIVDRGDEAGELLDNEPLPDVVILDWMLPGRSGLSVCQKIRNNPATAGLAVIMLTARDQENDLILALNSGADDYIAKPFSIKELIARIKSIIRRTNYSLSTDTLKVAGIKLNRQTCKVKRNGRVLKLSATEFKLLEFFMSNPEAVFTRRQLLDKVWGVDKYIEERAIDACVNRLRAVINRRQEQDPIKTIYGIGYSFAKK